MNVKCDYPRCGQSDARCGICDRQSAPASSSLASKDSPPIHRAKWDGTIRFESDCIINGYPVKAGTSWGPFEKSRSASASSKPDGYRFHQNDGECRVTIRFERQIDADLFSKWLREATSFTSSSVETRADWKYCPECSDSWEPKDPACGLRSCPRAASPAATKRSDSQSLQQSEEEWQGPYVVPNTSGNSPSAIACKMCGKPFAHADSSDQRDLCDGHDLLPASTRYELPESPRQVMNRAADEAVKAIEGVFQGSPTPPTTAKQISATSPLGNFADVLAFYDELVNGRLDPREAEADFVMRGSDWRLIRGALTPTTGPYRTNESQEEGEDTLVLDALGAAMTADEIVEALNKLLGALASANAQIALDTGNIERIRNAGERAEAELETVKYGDNLKTLCSMVEGLHAMIFGVTSIESGDFAIKALKDGGSIHEYVHSMLRLLPPRIPPLESDGIGKPETAIARSATGRNDLAKLDTQLALLVNSFAGTAGEYYCHGLRRARAEIEAMRGG